MLLSGVPQGPPQDHFSIYICDMFFKAPSNIALAGYTDGTAPSTCSSNMQTARNSLQEAIEKLFQ